MKNKGHTYDVIPHTEVFKPLISRLIVKSCWKVSRSIHKVIQSLTNLTGVSVMLLRCFSRIDRRYTELIRGVGPTPDLRRIILYRHGSQCPCGGSENSSNYLCQLCSLGFPRCLFVYVGLFVNITRRTCGSIIMFSVGLVGRDTRNKWGNFWDIPHRLSDTYLKLIRGNAGPFATLWKTCEWIFVTFSG